ncbi:hypothetical protein [Mastigocoleus sp. MO_188.B34]|uniref:hypothetical protein n=1 Tax=Mastigocoleus sp. MO_188.B34 TaxID=3036635 RepID=UPI002622FC2D|nr:hypothetical protein [Mastigocoleus sp. MO_188.B34]MDJ0696936.1 hypothetical protein [Mastigocoleus sp. MO_188.B34]
MKNILFEISKQKILLAILGVLVSILSFQIWKWKSEQREKEIIKTTKVCQAAISAGNRYVENSQTLESLYLGLLENDAKRIERPGINATFKVGEVYVLMYNRPAKLIPSKPRYEGAIFEQFSQKSQNKPPALLVTAKSLLKNSKQAIVNSPCTPEEFVVSLDDLYVTIQAKDFEVNPQPFLF